ncbi:hypothetical protein VNO77_12955 [Canavalia gladiata]|uniref:Uncharacterized protein n=1 Tax=Canavalia gladiata TaxID=3824 RepID=A0AAN9M248_CANGL
MKLTSEVATQEIKVSCSPRPCLSSTHMLSPVLSVPYCFVALMVIQLVYCFCGSGGSVFGILLLWFCLQKVLWGMKHPRIGVRNETHIPTTSPSSSSSELGRPLPSQVANVVFFLLSLLCGFLVLFLTE